jgi:predicted Na+-dependent transporter
MEIKNFASIFIILISVSLGLLLPQVGNIWQPYSSVTLGFLMFMVALNVKPTELLHSIQDYRTIFFAYILIFFLPPLLALPAQFLFSPLHYIAIVLALSSPAAISSVFWCNIFRGYTPLALVVSISTNLLAIITIPVTMLIVTGVMASIDVSSIFLNLTYLIVIPVSVAQIIRKLLPSMSQKIIHKSPPIQHALFFLLLWGAISPGAAFTRTHPYDFLIFNIFFLIIFSLIFTIAYLVGKPHGKTHAIALGVVSSHKNSVLAIVIGGLFFGPAVLPPLIANVVAQNVFLIPARLALWKWHN